jgi:hypothetical protein
MRKQIVLTHEGVEGSPLYVGTSGSSLSGTRERTGQLALLMKDGTHANTGPPSASGNVTQTMRTLTDTYHRRTVSFNASTVFILARRLSGICIITDKCALHR